ncbi:MAG: AgmX/PglI C-terminal domain-containing protein [Deltaproteobacteria bacterium]|nr:AgmX/PglI C-terminal domain-containing protein [Deltaproteobacteria bacterium]
MSRLRAALIWHDEVMSDVVLDKPGPVTLGSVGTSTFVIPDLGLPNDFAILKPGSRGYLLNLGERMRGTISVEGSERSVEDFVRRGGEGDAPAGFRATAIGGKDWGVVDLDESGIHKLYFQFVPNDPPLPLAVLALELLMPALAFSIVLHGILLALTYKFEVEGDEQVWPGPRAFTSAYLVTRLAPQPEEKPEPKAVGATQAAPTSGEVKKVNTATKGREGKAGGEGKEPRARDPDAKDVPPEPPKVALMEDKNRAVLDNVINHELATSLGKFTGLPGERRKGGVGSGTGKGTGFGPGEGTGTTRGSKGNGPGGGGSVEGDFQSQGKIDAGDPRAPKGAGGTGSGVKEVAVVGTGTATGDFNGLTKEEIDAVVKKRAGLIRTCYQKQLDVRGKGLAGGKIVIHFVISADGAVTSTGVQSSQVNDDAVESCMRSQISRLKFPAKPGGGIVNYPFIFSQG